MSLKLVAVDGFSYQFTDSNVQATVSLTGTPSAKVKAGGNGVCKHGFSATVTNVTVPSAGAITPAAGPFDVTFSATATKVKADGSFVLRVDDETGTISATPKIPGSPPVDYPVSFKVKISAAGQSKMSAQ